MLLAARLGTAIPATVHAPRTAASLMRLKSAALSSHTVYTWNIYNMWNVQRSCSRGTATRRPGCRSTRTTSALGSSAQRASSSSGAGRLPAHAASANRDMASTSESGPPLTSAASRATATCAACPHSNNQAPRFACGPRCPHWRWPAPHLPAIHTGCASMFGNGHGSTDVVHALPIRQ